MVEINPNDEIVVEVEALCNVHSHEREGQVKKPLIEAAIEGGADCLLSMPNAEGGMDTPDHVIRYNKESESMVPPGQVMNFIPIMLLTENTTERQIDEAVDKGIKDCKILPYLRTTKSEKGVKRYYPMLPKVKHCGRRGMRVHNHFEHPCMVYGDRDAEYICLPVAEMFLDTGATVFWEHGSDARCIPFWTEMAKTGRFVVTMTPIHINTTEDYVRGNNSGVVRPPIKTADDMHALREFICKGYDWVINGPDSAYHPTAVPEIKTLQKMPEFGKCACGAFTAPWILAWYAHALMDHLLTLPNGLEIFNNFTSRIPRQSFGRPPPSRTIKLVRRPLIIPIKYQIGPEVAMPFLGGETINWQIAV